MVVVHVVQQESPLLRLIIQLSIYLAPISSIVLCCSPIPTIRHIVHDETIGHYPLLPYTIMVLNTSLWLTYGLLQQDTSLYVTNGISVLLAIYYWCTYIRYVPSTHHTTGTVSSSSSSSSKSLSAILPGTVRHHSIAICATILIALVYTIVVPYSSKHSRWLGVVAMVSGIALYASPLASLRHVMAAKCASSIPLPFTVASFVSCTLWTIYGLYVTNDFNVYTPGIIGCTLAFAQFSLKFYYGDNFLLEIQDDIHVLLDHDHHHCHPETVPLILESDIKPPLTTYHSLI